MFCAKVMLRSMLLKFRFTNFQSFRAEQELSLIAARRADSVNGVFSPAGLGEQVLPAAAIYGANASGKTAVFRALGLMATAVRLSQTHWLPDAPFPVDGFIGEATTMPSEFAVDFLLGGIRRQYGFAANSNTVRHEWLHVYQDGVRQVWFEGIEGRPISFETDIPGEDRMIEALVRKNSLFLSCSRTE